MLHVFKFDSVFAILHITLVRFHLLNTRQNKQIYKYNLILLLHIIYKMTSRIAFSALAYYLFICFSLARSSKICSYKHLYRIIVYVTTWSNEWCIRVLMWVSLLFAVVAPTTPFPNPLNGLAFQCIVAFLFIVV